MFIFFIRIRTPHRPVADVLDPAVEHGLLAQDGSHVAGELQVELGRALLHSGNKVHGIQLVQIEQSFLVAISCKIRWRQIVQNLCYI